MNEDRKQGEEPAEDEDPVLSMIKKFQIQIKGEEKNAGLSYEEEAEDKTTGSRREEDTKSKS